MNENYVRANNKLVQVFYDVLSILRRNLIKEGTTSYWVYDRVIRQAILESQKGNRKKANYLFRHRLMTFVNQGFKVERYLEWIFSNEPTPFDLEELAAEASTYPLQPLISIVTPVFHPPVDVLAKMLDSVRKQNYPNWEHCIVNADPTDETSWGKIKALARQEKRIVASSLNENLGIARNTNEAIKMAKGEWIAFLDHDDQLSPFALFEVVKLINEHPDADVIYSDEDKLRSSDQLRFSPFFKPDFNWEYLRCVNYMTHFFVVRKSLGDSIGWLDPAYDGSQDYDLALKLTEKTSKIFHIPKILYHWKIAEGSAAGSSTNKGYAVGAGERALRDHMLRCGIKGYVEPDIFPYQLHYSITGEPKISMIIPNRDNCPTLKRLIDSVAQKSSYANYEMVIVENGSKEEDTFAYYDHLRKDPKIRIIEWKEEFNYSKVNNFGEEHASGDVILLLNNDLEVISGQWLERMLEHAQRPEVGAVGAKLYYPNDKIQHAGVIVGMFGAAGHSHKFYDRDSSGYYNRLICVQSYLAVTAACLMIRRKVYEEVGGLDPAFKVEFGDVDFCLRIYNHGYRNLWTPYAELYHHESLTRGGGYDTEEKKQLNRKEVLLFQSRWADILKRGDPSYNPNLTYRREDFYFD